MSKEPPESKGWKEAAKNADLTITLPGGVPMYFRRIPSTVEAGLPEGFLMGSRGVVWTEEPVHRVVIPHAFYMATFPVTEAQWKIAVGSLAAWRGAKDPSRFKGDSHPVGAVNWDQVQEYCDWLTMACEMAKPKWMDDSPSTLNRPQACLPAEAWWEWACRGGTETQYYNGDGEDELAEVGWYAGNSIQSTQPVGQLKPNAYGLYDLHGNVWEWCEDVYDKQAYRKRADGWEPTAWTLEQAGDDVERRLSDFNLPSRVLRGGAFSESAIACRSAFRSRFGPDDSFSSYGFRVCLVPGPMGELTEYANGASGIEVGGQGTRQETDGTGALGAVIDLSRERFKK